MSNPSISDHIRAATRRNVHYVVITVAEDRDRPWPRMVSTRACDDGHACVSAQGVDRVATASYGQARRVRYQPCLVWCQSRGQSRGQPDMDLICIHAAAVT